MSPETLHDLFAALQKGTVTPHEAVERLIHLPYEDITFAKIDHHRPLRTGLPEVIYAAGKTEEQVVEIFDRMAQKGGNVLATRVPPAVAEAVRTRVPAATYHEIARALFLGLMCLKIDSYHWMGVCKGLPNRLPSHTT